MNFNLDPINILILFVMVLNSIYGFIIYSRNKSDRTNFSFFVLTMTISLWGFSMFCYRGFEDHDTVLLMARALYFSAITIPTAFIYFVIVFPDANTRMSWRQKYLIPIPMILLCVLSLYPGTIGLIHDVILRQGTETVIVLNMIEEIAFSLYVVSYFGWAYWIIFKKYARASGILKTQLGYIFIGTFGSTMLTLLTNMGLLYFNYFALNWVGQIGIIFMITLIFYSILKFNLFHIKIISAEIVTFGLWLFILIRTILAVSIHDFIIQSSLLFITIIFGIMLIRSILKETKQKEALASLNQYLEQRVAEQTAEVREAYELEKRARGELEKLNDAKDQFIMITQHHLRTPLTEILWALESSLKDECEKISPMLREVLTEAEQSGHRLMRIIDDFLNITAIKVGTNILTLSTQSLLPAVEDILNELKSDIRRLRLSIEYPTDPNLWLPIALDYQKMRESLFIVIENAVRYNQDGGSIKIMPLAHDGQFELSIVNTGIGISCEESSKIGSALFYRGDYARKVYPIGMGVGLSVVKAIIRAHHGSLAINSDGTGKGALVIIKLPIEFKVSEPEY